MLKPPRQINFEPFGIIIFLCLLQVMVAFLTTYRGLGFDEAIWHYIGRNWFRHGLIPYTGGVDNKSPLIYLIYGFSDLMFGLNFWFPRLLAIACQTAGIYFVYKIANHFGGKKAGLIAIILYGLSLTWQSTDGKSVSQTQAYEITFLLASFYYYFSAEKNKDFFFAGILAGIAIAFKFTAVFPGMLIGCALIYKKHIAASLIFLTGVLASSALLTGLLFLSGISLPDFMLYSFSDNFTAGSVTDHPWRWKLEQCYNQFLHSGMVLFYPFVMAWLVIRKKMDILMLWLIASLMGLCIIGMFARSHLKEILPQLSVMSTLSITYLQQRYALSMKAVVIVLLVFFFPKTTEPFWALQTMFNPKNDHPKISSRDDMNKQLGLWIRSNTRDGEKVYIAGYSALAQVYSERLSPSIYFNATQTPVAKKRLFDDLSLNKPAMIAIPVFPEYDALINKETRQFIDGIVADNYKADTTLLGYHIYRQK